MANFKKLLEERARVDNVLKDIEARCKSEGRAMLSDEEQQFDKALEDFKTLTSQINKMQEANDLRNLVTVENDIETTVQPKAEKRDLETEYEKRFWDTMKYGRGVDTGEIRKVMQEFEKRGTNTITTTTAGTTYGGYAIPKQFSNELELQMEYVFPYRSVLRVFPTNGGGTLHWPTLNDTATDAAWTTEGSALTVQDMTFGEVTFSSYTLATLAKVSVEWFEDEAINFNGILAEIFGERLGRALSAAVTDGDGSGKPTGFQDNTTKGVDAAVSALTRDNIVDLIHSVDRAYRNKPSTALMMKDSTMAYIRKLAFGSADDRPLFQASTREGEPDRIEGERIVINNDMEAVGISTKSLQYGDWSKYVLREVATPTMVRLNERFMDALSIGFIMFGRFDGKLLNSSAIKHVLHAAS